MNMLKSLFYVFVTLPPDVEGKAVELLQQIILKNKYATQKHLDSIDASVKEHVSECEKFAESSPYPEKSLMYDAVYEDNDYPFIKHKL